MSAESEDRTDTDRAVFARYLDLVRSVPKSQRMMRALALSALAREMTWCGARRHSGHLGNDAVTERFLQQLYGPDVGREIAALLQNAER
ncbi:MAG TPA: hypothetical protein VFW89_09665 [Gemmatimonadaceae bacterium]|nr:hypothetical protein [Gemmatimonadaceae bacterium]